MAGQDQSVNLTGMLSSIAETLGSGYEIGGVSAGEALGNNIREAAKPELDMKDPVSIRKYAEWAGRNGKDEESLLMQQKAAEVEEELKYNKNMGEVRTTASQGSDYANAGEAELLQVRIKQLDDKARELAMSSPEAAEKAQQAADSLRAKVGGAKQVQFGNQVSHLEKIREALKTGEWTGSEPGAPTKKLTADERRGLEAQRDRYERSNPDVVLNADKAKVDKAATKLQLREADLVDNALPRVRLGVRAGMTVDQIIDANPNLEVHRSDMESEYQLLQQQHLDGEALRESIRESEKPYDDAFLTKRIEDLPVELQGGLLEELKDLRTKVKDGKIMGGEKDSVQKRLDAVLQTVANQEATVRNNDYNMGKESREQARTAAAQLEVDIDTGVISTSFLEQAAQDYADEYSDGVVDDEPSADAAATIQEFAREAQVDAARRLNIRAGVADYVPLLQEDREAAVADIREANKTLGKDDAADEIAGITETLLASNHDPEMVADLVGKELEEIQYVIDMIDADDAARAAQAQDEFNQSYNEGRVRGTRNTAPATSQREYRTRRSIQ